MIVKCDECKNYDICNRIITLCEELEDPPYSQLKSFEPIEKENKIFETEGKTLYKCIKTFASDPEEYGTDFYEGKEYYGEREDNEYLYLDSTENGTCVLISNEELVEYFELA